jgi:CRP/FNR family cyclic AMP-dependent transcriptional regulator
MGDSKKILDRLVIAEGSAVFKEGERGDRAYVVQEGMIEIARDGEDGNLIVLGMVEKGGIFGEMALIDDQPRMATARAAVATTVIAVPRNVFAQKLAKCDPFIRGLLGIFVRNIRSMTPNR